MGNLCYPEKMIEERENAISGTTISKTIVFLLYSFLVPLLILALFALTPLRDLPREIREKSALALFLGIEGLLFLLVARGYLAWAIPKQVKPFSESQLEIGVVLLSLTPWLLRFDPDKFKVFQVIVNGSLCIAVFIFFFTKTALSRRYRWEVLRVMILPALQLYLLFR